MKNFVILFLSCVLFACSAQESGTYYGETFEYSKPKQVSELSTLLANNETAEVVLSAEIITSCAKKGCWMSIKNEAGEDIRVTFKDYGFFVPTEGLGGKKAIIKGEASVETTSVEELRHYAEDAGKSQEEIESINQAKEEISFVATGVKILDK